MLSSSRSSLLSLALSAVATATTLQDVCIASYIQSSLPDSDFGRGISINSNSVAANAVTGAVSNGSYFFPTETFDYCNITFSYSHNGLDDVVNVWYWLPAPADYKNRFLATGGGGYAINSGDGSLPGGVIYGAAAGCTDGGFGGFDNQFTAVDLLANGTLNWQEMTMFGYEAIHEMTMIGKAFAQEFYNATASKLYTYYQGCSEGGREGWSQVQRFANEIDGAIVGAPAYRFAHQQVQHSYSNVVEQTIGYYPPPCELQKIVNETISACDALDGKVDGVLSRSDLCKLHFNISSLLGVAYSCAATAASAGPTGVTAALPAQNGTISAEGIQVAQTILNGLHDSQGRQAYFSYQPGATFADAATQYDSSTDTWELDINTMGAVYVERYLYFLNGTTLPNLDNVTYDTLVHWMKWGWAKYDSVLQTTYPDLTDFEAAGGKVIHFHGEADNSIPTASSVRYWESVRQIMYPGLSYNESADSLKEWYRLYVVPGAVHCGPNDAEPNGPFPNTNMAVMIDWVENGVKPDTLNATAVLGDDSEAQICAWPLRPLWSSDGTMDCVYDQASLDTWHYNLDAFKMPVY